MSDEKKRPEDEDELVLDWDDEWEDEPTSQVSAEHGHLAAGNDPQPKAPSPGAPGAKSPPAPMYRPPSPGGPRAAAPQPLDDVDPELDLFDVEEEEEPTRIAAIPQELMASLQALDQGQQAWKGVSSASTQPPPQASHAPNAAAPTAPPPAAPSLPDPSAVALPETAPPAAPVAPASARRSFDEDEEEEDRTAIHDFSLLPYGALIPTADEARGPAHTTTAPPPPPNLPAEVRGEAPAPTLPDPDEADVPVPLTRLRASSRPPRPTGLPTPARVLAEPVSDAPEIAIGGDFGDDEDWDFVSNVDFEDLSDLAPPEGVTGAGPASPPAEAPEPEAPAQRDKRARDSDRAAQAARRTVVRGRRRRAERMPLVGVGPEVDAARRELLYALAQSSQGPAAASLYAQAAELAEATGDSFAARDAYTDAQQADPECAQALRGLTRLCMADHDWAEAYELLMRESNLALPEPVLADAAATAALLAWSQLDDPGRAEVAATRARSLSPESPHLAALLLRIQQAEGDDAQAGRATLALADRVSDAALAASLRVQAALRLEQSGARAEALTHYERAAAGASPAADALLGIARTARAEGRHEAIARALAGLCDLLGPEAPAWPALRRAHARCVGAALGRPAEALSLLEGASDAVSLRARARWAQAAGDAEAALAAWAEGSLGSERALASLELAEWQSARGDAEAAEDSLSRARDADGTLSLTRVVREVLARRAGDRSRLAEARAGEQEDAGATLAAAARLASDADAVENERAWLAKANGLEDAATCARVLALDAAAQALDEAAVHQALVALAGSDEPQTRVAASLALADRARRAGDAAGAAARLEQALSTAQDNTLLSRALTRLTEDPERRRALLGAEAARCEGVRAASLHLACAEGLDGEARLNVLEASYAEGAGYPPARWPLIDTARRAGDLDRLYALCLDEATDAPPPHSTAALVRAALIGAERDTDRAADLLVQSAGQDPGDTILRVLVSRVGDAVSPDLRAELFGQGVESADGPLTRVLQLAAAGAYEDASAPEKALELYESVMNESPLDPVARDGFERLAGAAGRQDALRAHLVNAHTHAAGAEQRARALRAAMRLAWAEGRQDDARRLAAQALETEPGDAESQRLLERSAMERADHAELFALARRTCDHSGGARDRGAHIRLMSIAARMGDAQDDSALDPSLCQLATQLLGGAWLARRLITAGRTQDDPQTVAAGWKLLLELLTTPVERAAVRMRIAECRPADEIATTEALREAVEMAPHYSLAWEALAERLVCSHDLEAAADALERAAKTAHGPARKVRLWHRAGVIWQDGTQVLDRAREALRAAAEIDVAFADVSARLERLLGGRQDIGGLIALTESRVAAGGTPAQLAQLHRSLADLHAQNGDRPAARASLRATLTSEPEDLDSLRRLADLCERDDEYRECAEVWIQVARQLRDPAELSEVFFKLGRLYDVHLPDAARAEAAYRRVLKLAPSHAGAYSALARLYESQGQLANAVEALSRLARVSADATEKRGVVLRLAELLERAERGSDAERVLEALRRDQPTDATVLSALAELYRRQAAGAALAMHTNRAAADLRQAIGRAPEASAQWTALTKVLSWRGHDEPCQVVATTAKALGIQDPEIDRLAPDGGVLPGAGGGVRTEDVVSLIAAEPLSAALRGVLAGSSETLQKVMPFDPRAADAERLSRKHPMRAQAREIGRWFGQGEAELLVSPRVPTSFLSVSDAEPTFLIGSQLVDTLTPTEQRFLLARAYALSSAGMSVVCRVSPEDLAVLMHGLVLAFADTHSAPGLDPATLSETARRIQKAMPRKAREQLHAGVVEVGGALHFDPANLYVHCSAFATRTALLATGAVEAALSSLCKLAGSLSSGDLTPAIVQHTKEARELVAFAVSEAHFEARRRAGVDAG